ncbi:MAG: ECF-type sigma factor [Planctomycetota bacterium]
MKPIEDATLLMSAASAGDSDAASRLLPLVYDQLRAAAQFQLSRERSDHTLQATEIVHEAFMKLVGPRTVPWADRRHFYAAAAEAMRQILIDHARSKGRKKRGGAVERLELDFRGVADLANNGRTEEILALDDAICRLEIEKPRLAQVVRLRFFAGLSVDSTAAALGVSPRTVDLDWSFARAWLFRVLSDARG